MIPRRRGVFGDEGPLIQGTGTEKLSIEFCTFYTSTHYNLLVWHHQLATQLTTQCLAEGLESLPAQERRSGDLSNDWRTRPKKRSPLPLLCAFTQIST